MQTTKHWIPGIVAALLLILPLAPMAAMAATAQEDPAAAAPQTQPATAQQTTEEQAAGAVTQAVSDTAAQVAEQGSAVWSEMLMPMLQGLAAGLPSILKAFALLVVFWIVAVVVGTVVRKVLRLAKIDDHAAKILGLGDGLEGEEDKPRSIAAMAGTGVKWIILAFGLLAFFDALQLGMVAGPLQNILGKITGVIPSLLQAAIILGVYWLIATLLKIVATKGLEASGFDQKASKYVASREIKGEEVGPSGLVGRLLFYIVMLFGIPPVLDALGQQSLVAPLRDMMSKMFEFLPNIIGAVILLLIGKIVATIVRGIVESFLSGVGFDGMPERFGLGFLKPKDGGATLSSIGGTVVMAIILLLAVEQALTTLQLGELSALVGGLLGYLPNLVVGLVIILAALSLGNYVGKMVADMLSGTDHAGLAAAVAKYAIVFLGFSMGLNQLGVGREIVQVAVSAVLGGSALALGLAFGLGGRDRAKEIIERQGSGG